MKNLTIALFASCLASLAGFSAADEVLNYATQQETGKVLIYRPHDKRSERVDLNVYLADGRKRLKSRDHVEFELAPGEYKVLGNLRGSKPFLVTVKAGQSRYIRTQMKRSGGQYKAMFREVSDKLAHSELPELEAERWDAEQDIAFTSP